MTKSMGFASRVLGEFVTFRGFKWKVTPEGGATPRSDYLRWVMAVLHKLDAGWIPDLCRFQGSILKSVAFDLSR